MLRALLSQLQGHLRRIIMSDEAAAPLDLSSLAAALDQVPITVCNRGLLPLLTYSQDEPASPKLLLTPDLAGVVDYILKHDCAF